MGACIAFYDARCIECRAVRGYHILIVLLLSIYFVLSFFLYARWIPMCHQIEKLHAKLCHYFFFPARAHTLTPNSNDPYARRNLNGLFGAVGPGACATLTHKIKRVKFWKKTKSFKWKYSRRVHFKLNLHFIYTFVRHLKYRIYCGRWTICTISTCNTVEVSAVHSPPALPLSLCPPDCTTFILILITACNWIVCYTASPWYSRHMLIIIHERRRRATHPHRPIHIINSIRS